MTIEQYSLVWWLIVILVIAIISGVYLYKFHRIGVGRIWRGFFPYCKEWREQQKKDKDNPLFSISARTKEEILWLSIALFIGVSSIMYLCDEGTQEYIHNILKSVRINFTNKYPLITTIIGAFIALICDYLFVHPKIYVSPDAFIYTDTDGKERLAWYIENRSIFDCVDVHADVFKCETMNDAGDLQSNPIELRTSDIAVIAGRGAKSNDRSLSVSVKDFKREMLDKEKLAYFELYIKVTHSLSHVTKTVVKQYRLADIYEGEWHGNTDTLHAFNNPQATITSLKAEMLQRFMFCRKFESICIAIMFCLLLGEICFPKNEFYTLGLANALLMATSLTTILFSIMRFIYHIPVITDADDENKLYRVKNMEQQPQENPE